MYANGMETMSVIGGGRMAMPIKGGMGGTMGYAGHFNTACTE